MALLMFHSMLECKRPPSLVLCWHLPVLPVAQHWVTSCLLCAPGPLQTTPPTITKVRQLVKKVFDPKQNLVKRTGPLPRPVGKECKVCCMHVCACVRVFYQWLTVAPHGQACRLPPRLRKAVPLFQRLLKAHKWVLLPISSSLSITVHWSGIVHF